MNLQHFEDLARQSAMMIGGREGLQIPFTVALENGTQTLAVRCVIKSSADDGRNLTYDFNLGAIALEQPDTTVRRIFDEHFTRGTHTFFFRRSKTSW